MDSNLPKDGLSSETKMSIGFIVAMLIVAAVGFSAHIITHRPDTEVEQVAEEIIKDETGIVIDFSSDMKEKEIKK